MTTDDTHKLLVTDGNAKGREIVIGSGEFLIGRLADDDDGRLADDLELSRRHARIMRTLDGGIEIEDLGSTNGTYVNDQKVTTRRRLEPGDVIEVGQTRLSVLDAAGRSAQPTQFGRVRPAAQETPRTPLVAAEARDRRAASPARRSPPRPSSPASPSPASPSRSPPPAATIPCRRKSPIEPETLTRRAADQEGLAVDGRDLHPRPGLQPRPQDDGLGRRLGHRRRRREGPRAHQRPRRRRPDLGQGQDRRRAPRSAPGSSPRRPARTSRWSRCARRRRT